MYSFKKVISTAVGGLAIAVAVSTAASAATLSLFGSGGTPTQLPASFDLVGAAGPGTPAVDDWVTVYQAGADGGSIDGGIEVSKYSRIRYTFLGKEAGAVNTVFSLGGNSIVNTDAVGSFFGVNDGAGALTFNFTTLFGGPKVIHNGGTADLAALSMSFSVAADGQSALAFFGDGRLDSDFDDMLVRIDIVPLPASALLLLGGMGGLGALRLRKKA